MARSRKTNLGTGAAPPLCPQDIADFVGSRSLLPEPMSAQRRAALVAQAQERMPLLEAELEFWRYLLRRLNVAVAEPSATGTPPNPL